MSGASDVKRHGAVILTAEVQDGLVAGHLGCEDCAALFSMLQTLGLLTAAVQKRRTRT